MITVNPHLRAISAYAPGASPEQIKAQYGLDHVEKLASNENPLGCSPLARRAALQALDNVHLYNDGGSSPEPGEVSSGKLRLHQCAQWQ